jgi:hypothetical protein
MNVARRTTGARPLSIPRCDGRPRPDVRLIAIDNGQPFPGSVAGISGRSLFLLAPRTFERARQVPLRLPSDTSRRTRVSALKAGRAEAAQAACQPSGNGMNGQVSSLSFVSFAVVTRGTLLTVPFKSRILGATNVPGEASLAAHRCSKLLCT